MYLKNTILFRVSLLFLLTIGTVYGQLPSKVYTLQEKKEGRTVFHELKIEGDYFVHSVYETTPPRFVKTVGGFYTTQGDTLKVALEFNSNYQEDGISVLAIPYQLQGLRLLLDTGEQMAFTAAEGEAQALDGQWLFATRGPDSGQERRGEQNTRKTLKFLLNGRFQWIAYDTEGFQFKGTGGGSYTANDGKYTERIDYFSRDNARVGASLEFQYELQENDWHHRGKNSRGKPMYEIWAKRIPKE